MTEINASSAHLKWDHSDQDGGSPITGYLVEKRDAERSNWVNIGTVTPDKSSMSVSNLWEGCEYYFRVSAENAVGASDPCELDKPVTAKLPFCK